MLIINGNVHNGLGEVARADIRILDGRIAAIAPGLEAAGDEEVFDAAGMEVLPGFVFTVSHWGVNGSMTEIRPSSDDNDEKSNPITPELDAFYAFNGRAVTAQQMGAFGVTACGVAPTDNNLFGGKIAAFTVDGVNPYRMVLRRDIGMMASVTNSLKQTYGARQVAPMTRMWIFTSLAEQLRKASEYKEEADKPKDDKLAAIRRVVDGELPLFMTCDTALALNRVREILSSYPKIRLVIVNGFELDGSEDWIVDGGVPVVVRNASFPMDEYAMRLDWRGVAKLAEKGATVALSGNATNSVSAREDLMWNAAEMMRVVHDSEKVLPMITSAPAKILGIDDQTGSLREGLRADLVVWSANPLETWNARVVRTFMGGETIYREGDALKCM